MKDSKKKFILNFIGIFLIVLGLVRIFQLLFFGVPVHVFWFCNHILVFMGVAILFRSSFWSIAEFQLLFFGEFFWVISFLLYWVFGIAIPGSSAYLLYDEVFINLISILIHLLTLPLGLIAIFLLKKPGKHSWKGSLLHFGFLVPFIIYFGAEYNLNCVLRPCFDFVPNFLLYPLFIFLVYLFFTVIPINYLLNYLIKRSNK